MTDSTPSPALVAVGTYRNFSHSIRSLHSQQLDPDYGTDVAFYTVAGNDERINDFRKWHSSLEINVPARGRQLARQKQKSKNTGVKKRREDDWQELDASRKEDKMGFIIAVLVAVILVIVIMRMT